MGLTKIVDILASTLVTLIVIVIIFIAVIIILIVVVVKVNRRRKVERDLVLRTKQDIFEGVPSGVTQEEMSSITKYNVDVAILESSVAKDGGDGEAESKVSPTKTSEDKGAERENTSEENSQKEAETSDAGGDEHSSNNNVTSNST